MAIQQLVGARFEKWKLDHFRAMSVRTLEDVCASLGEFADQADAIWKTTVAQLLAGEIENPEATGQEARTLLQGLEKELNWVEATIAAMQKDGYEVKGAEQVGRARQRIQADRAKLEAKWPFIDRKAVAESRAQIERGECHP